LPEHEEDGAPAGAGVITPFTVPYASDDQYSSLLGLDITGFSIGCSF